MYNKWRGGNYNFFPPSAGNGATLQTSDVTSPAHSSQRTPRRHAGSTHFASSPGSQGVGLFSSPPSHVPASEIDVSSPLSYGTPSSRVGLPTARSGSTPIRPRNDIGMAGRVREVNLTTGAADPIVSSSHEK